MNLMPDLFSFAYVPGWYEQLDELAELAIPEPWRFRNPNYYTKNQDTPILERYIHSIFKKQVIDYNEEQDSEKAAGYFHVENEYACFHTGLYTRVEVVNGQFFWGMKKVIGGFFGNARANKAFQKKLAGTKGVEK